MKTCLIGLIAATITAVASPAWSQAYPSKTIRIIVPTSTGGGNDTMARIIAQKLSGRLKQPVIVDNRAGGNGSIASEQVAKASPDGYTILFGYIATHGINPALQKLPFDAVKDFAPIGQVASAPGVLVVNPSVPAKTVQELIALAKSKPGKLNYASAGNGTAPHIAAEQFKLLTETKMEHVAYKGSAPAVMDTVAGHTDLMFPSLVAANQHLKSGKLRALAITSKSRSSLHPELPTVAESGVPGFEISQWYGFFAPAKTPAEIVDRLHKEIDAVMKEPDTVKRFSEQGADVVVSSPQEFGRFVQAEIDRWAKVVKAADIKAD